MIDPSLADLPLVRLGELAESSLPAERALFSGLHGPSLTPSAVLAAARSEDLVGPMARLFELIEAGPGERSEALHQAIVLNGASAPSTLQCALVCVERSSGQIGVSHGRSIIRRCLSLASQPVNPYAPSAISMAARSAAVALLSTDPSLDEQVLDQIRAAPNGAEMALILAAALQVRQSGFGEGVAAGLRALSPSEEQALTFARDCDRNFSALDSTTPKPGRPRLALAQARRWCERFAPMGLAFLRIIAIIAIPAGAGLLAIGVDRYLVVLPDDVTISGGGALAALGILVAVHVLSAELAADRLAGPIARVISFPLALQAGYAAGLALLFRSLLHPPKADLATYSAVVVGITAGMSASVLVVLVTLVQRTDSVRAIDAFVARRTGAIRRAGRALGRLQKAAIVQRDLLASLPFFKNALGVPLGDRRMRIDAVGSGYLLVSPRRVRRLARREAWREERIRILIVTSLGLEVSRGEEVMSAVPSEDSAVGGSEARQLRALQQIRRGGRIDAVGEYVGVILGVAASQAAAGNLGGARRIRDSTLRVLAIFLQEMRRKRDGGTERDELVGMSSVLRASAVQALRLLADYPDANSREMLTSFLQRLLDVTDRADGFGVHLATQLGAVHQPLDDALVRQLLWDCVAQAIRVEDDLAVEALRRQIVRRQESDDSMIELGARFVQLAAVNRPDRAETLWEWYVGWAEKKTGFGLGAMRVGASALRVGNATVGLRVALAFKGRDLPVWRSYFEQDQAADSEGVQDQLYGFLLGEDAQHQLLEFVDFAERVIGVMKP